MASMYTSDGHLARAIITRILLVAVTTAIIVTALPRSSKTKIDYTPNRPWTKIALIAPYEIPILKTDSIIQAERDSVERGVAPYYNIDKSIANKQSKRFMAKNHEGIEGLPKSFLSIVERKLNEIYSIGIIAQEDYSTMMLDTMANIQIVSGNMTERKEVRNLLTPLSAYEYFFADHQMAVMKGLLQQCNINDYLEPNVTKDVKRTQQVVKEELAKLSNNTGLIYQGEKIIDRGDIVTPELAQRIDSYIVMLSKNDSDKATHVTLFGQIIFVMLIMTLLTTYMHLFRGDYFAKPRSILMVYIFVTIFPVVVALMMKYSFVADYVYILPYAMLPIFIRVFLDSRTAVMAHFAMILLCALSVADQYDFLLIELLSGIVAIYVLRDLQKRSQIIQVAVLVTLLSVLILALQHFMLPGDDVQIDVTAVKYMAISGVSLLLTYPLMFLIEKLFGFTSAVTLFELSDTNKDLLRNLSEVAPGTFQHSMMVGNLASAIATKIGAKALLVRTGALYHDIGKTVNPVFFTENQAGVSPHERMTPIESAQVIISHVKEGLRLADKHGLPEVIRSFILTHHGTGMAKYFYITYKNAHPDEEVDEKLFTYPGPNPFTREHAILMMADAVEAASRSLPEYTEESITNLVNRIVDAQVAEGYFRECPITFRDIATAKWVLIDKLKSIYHTRVSYPELNKNKQ